MFHGGMIAVVCLVITFAHGEPVVHEQGALMPNEDAELGGFGQLLFGVWPVS